MSTPRQQAIGTIGRWRVVEMELWDRDVLDLVKPAFIEIGKEGGLGFIAVEAGSLKARIYTPAAGGPSLQASSRPYISATQLEIY